MKRRRRLRFAAPLVIVTTASCGRPAPVETPAAPPIEGLDHVRDAEAARGDAGVDVAAPVDAPAKRARFVTVVVPGYVERPSGYVSCHDFGPRNRGCNPPRPIHHPEERRARRILDVQEHDGEVVITIETADDDRIGYGVVWGRTAAMPSLTEVGRVRSTRGSTATLVVSLSLADVMAGVELEIDGTTAGRAAGGPTPVTGRILDVQADGAGAIITIGAGSRVGVDRGWRVEVVDRRDRPVPNGRATVVKVTNQTAVAKVKLSPSQLTTYDRVRLSPEPSR